MALTVVVVDDDGDYRMIVRYLLATVPHEMSLVGEAEDGQRGYPWCCASARMW